MTRPAATPGRAALALAAVLLAAPVAARAQGAGVVGEVRVHGNHTTPDADVLGIAGDIVGRPATDALVADVTARLQASGRFDGVEVRRRFRSIADPTDILVMIIVDEVPAVSADDLTPGPWKRFRSSGMFLPVLYREDGYGFTYGARVSFVERLGPKSRISVPLTWGGERQARVQVERAFASGPITRVAAEGGVGRRENPHYRVGDTRVSVEARVESAFRRWLRVGAGAGLDDVTFGGRPDRLGRVSADLAVDTRVDPAFPRNAVHAAFGVERLTFDAGRATRRQADLRGYVGLFGQTVLAVRGVSITSPDPVPGYEQSLLGGEANLRGFDAGHAANDNLAAVSAELRIPVTSPLSIGRLGVKVFVDAGTAYAAGERLEDQRFERGYGAGAYMHLTLLRLSLDAARSQYGSWRWHFGMGVTFR